jgi:hypothetical protein
MNPATILADVQSILQIGNIALQLGEDVAPFITQIKSAVSGVGLTDAQRAALLQQEATIRAALQAPLPAESTPVAQ